MANKKIVSGLFWKFAERIGAQGVNLIVSFVLARFIAPNDYGVIALITIFINISNVFIESGLGTALIQKKNADSLDFSSVFYTNVVASVIMYVILFFAAPLIAGFYNNDILVPVVRVFGITILIAGLKNIQHAYVSRNMMFKKFFISTLFGTIISAIIGIYMAYKGFGVWALVTQQLVNTTIDTLILWLTVKWRPKLIFSFKRVKELFSFGWKLLCSSLIDNIYNELYGLVIGKVYTSSDLAFYNRANQMPKMIAINIDGSMQSVMLPALSQEQDNKKRIKQMMRKTIKASTFVLFPAMLGLAAVSENVITLILTDKWAASIPLMQMLCVSYILWPIHTVNLQAMNAVGRSDLFLKLEIAKKIIGIAALFISIPFGIYTMVVVQILTAFISMVINTYPSRKLFNYGLISQIKDIIPTIICSLVMFVAILVLPLGSISCIAQLVIKVILGIVIYIALSNILNKDNLDYIKQQLLDMIKPKIKKGDKM